MQNRRQPEIIAGYVASDGSIQRSTAEGVVGGRTAVGQFNLTFPSNFRLHTITVTGGGAVAVCRIDSITERVVSMTWVTPNTLAAVDTNYSFVAVGFQI